MDALVTRNLRKAYGRHRVLHGIGLRVPRGAIYGFLGPNGSGKSTTIRVLLGLLKRDGGTVDVLGQDPWRDGRRLRADIGYLPGDIALYPHRTGRATLRFVDMTRRRRSGPEIERLATVFDLPLDKRVRDYSRGMKQKLGLILALMHKPPLLILDEPTIALDPLMRDVLRLELRQAASEGRTVLFSSHTLSEVAELCDWVAILRAGKLIEQDRIDSLRRRAVRKVDVIFDGRGGWAARVPDKLQVIKRQENRLQGRWIGSTPRLLEWLSGESVQDVVIAPPDLEDLFMAYYSEDGA